MIPIAVFRKMDWTERLEAVLKMKHIHPKYHKQMLHDSERWTCCSTGEKLAWSKPWSAGMVHGKTGSVFRRTSFISDDSTLYSLSTDFPIAILHRQYELALGIHKQIQNYAIPLAMQEMLE